MSDNENNKDTITVGQVVSTILALVAIYCVFKYFLHRANPATDVAKTIVKKSVSKYTDGAIMFIEGTIEANLASENPDFKTVVGFADYLDYIGDVNVDADNKVTIPIALGKAHCNSSSLYGDSASYIRSMRKIITTCDLGKSDTSNRNALIWNTIIGLEDGVSDIVNDKTTSHSFDPHLWLERELAKNMNLNFRDKWGLTAIDHIRRTRMRYRNIGNRNQKGLLSILKLYSTEHLEKIDSYCDLYYNILVSEGALLTH